VGATPVNFAGIAAADRPQGLANGMNVEASGKRFKSGVLLADRLRDRDRDRIHVPDGDLFEVQGYVAGFVSIAEFTVDGYAVDASSRQAVFAHADDVKRDFGTAHFVVVGGSSTFSLSHLSTAALVW